MAERLRRDYEDDLESGIDYTVLLGVATEPEPSEVFLATRAKLQGILGDIDVLGRDLAIDQANRVKRACDTLTGDERARYLTFLRYHRRAASEDPDYAYEQF